MLLRLPVAVVAFDAGGTCVWWNERARALLGSDLPAVTLDDFDGAGVDPCRRYRVHRIEQEDDPDGGSGLTWLALTEGHADKDLLDEFAHQALHDHLTGLPNRLLLADRVRQALNRASRSRGSVAVAFLDLDHFKLINDTQGHAAGDALLRAVAQRLSTAVRAADTVARFGGDEFVVVYEDVADHREATGLAERLREALEAPFVLGGEPVYVAASLGVALGRPDSTPDELLRDADAAMYHAKTEGRARTQMFDDRIRARAERRRDTEKALRIALADGQFHVAYQPIVSLEAGWVVGAEALLRWEHPEQGLIPPGEFVPVAEETGLILALGEWVLDHACRQLGEWRRQLADVPLFMAVNMSARHLRTGVADLVARTASEHALDPSVLVIEITEGSVMADVTASLEALQALKDTGAGIALDDFGVGYSSLDYLKRFPIDTIKIARSFVNGLGTDRNDSAIVSAIAAIARGLKVDVVADGVETPEQLYALRRLTCQYAQGGAFAPALDPEDFAELVRSRPRW